MEIDEACFTLPDLESSLIQPPLVVEDSPEPAQPPLPAKARVKKSARHSKPSVEDSPEPAQLPLPAKARVKKMAKHSKPSVEEDDTASLVQAMAETMRLGRSYRSIGFDKECAIVNCALAERGK